MRIRERYRETMQKHVIGAARVGIRIDMERIEGLTDDDIETTTTSEGEPGKTAADDTAADPGATDTEADPSSGADEGGTDDTAADPGATDTEADPDAGGDDA